MKKYTVRCRRCGTYTSSERELPSRCEKCGEVLI